MAVRSGYKQTDVGVIPEEWEAVEYTSFGRIIDGDRGEQYPGAGDLRAAGYCLFLNAGNVTKRGFRFSECQFITAEKDRKLSKGKLVRGDVVLTTRGTLGNFAHFDEGVPFERMRINSGMVILRNTSPTVSDRYQFFVLQSRVVASQIERLSFGSAQPQLTVKGIGTFKIPIPPTKAEQEAIAGALSDADALIESLDALIAKKSQIKQGVMQELLTGNTRLPGFGGEWDVKQLGDICQIATGKKDVNEGNPDGRFPFFTCSRSHTFSDSYSFDTEAILIAGNGDVGNLHYYKGKFEAYQRTYVLSEFSTNVKYLWQELNAYLGDSLGLGKIGTSIPYIKKENLVTFEFRSPRDKAEQSAIAQILSDMDAEIAALESKLAKARQIKQGMMQELLTGRIRLV